MESSFYPYIGAFIWLSILLLAGTFLRAKVTFLQKMLVPASLIGGILGFFCVWAGIIGLPTSNGWQPIPTSVFSMVTFHLFAFGFVGVGLMKSKATNTNKVVARGGLWMALMFGLIWAIQGLIGKGIFEFWRQLTGGNFESCLGYLLGSGFAQGPGQAHAYGTIWQNTYQIANSVSVGLAFAAMGFLVAVAIGVPLANVGLKRGWITDPKNSSLPDFFLRGMMNKGDNPSCSSATVHPANIDNLGFHVAIMAALYGVAYSFGLAWTLYMPSGISGLGFGLLFTWGMCLAMIARVCMDKMGFFHIVDANTIRRITNSSVDYMICAVFLAISVSELQSILVPFFIAVVVASLASLLVIMWFARRTSEFSFERGLAIFGCYTGTVASGLLLLRIVDPEFESSVAVELGVMNVIILLTCQPLLAGYPFIPAEGFPMALIMLGYVVITPVAMYLLKLIRKPAW